MLELRLLVPTEEHTDTAVFYQVYLDVYTAAIHIAVSQNPRMESDWKGSRELVHCLYTSVILSDLTLHHPFTFIMTQHDIALFV